MLEEFFSPRSVAVVGASREEGKVGHDVVKNLIEYGYAGRIYPVNPKADKILGLTCYPSVTAAPGEVDLAVLVVPARFTEAVVRECGEKGVRALVIITAGFKESGLEGAHLERRILTLAQEHGMRIIGPNCLGLINTHHKLNASFAAGMPACGNIAFLSQSGAFGTAILDWAIGEQIGFSKFVSVGNKADVDEVSLLEAIGEDQDSSVILGYIESVNNGPEFVRVARAVTRKKPVVIMKSGGTAAGARAASSHTGALAGSEDAFVAALRQSGVIRATRVEELFDCALAFGFQGPMQGPNVAIVTNAGGPGIIATDAIERSSLKMAEFARETIDALREKLPPTSNLYNPVDVIGDARADRYEAALTGVIADPSVHGVIVIVTPQAMTEVEATAETIVRHAAASAKPVLGCFMGGPRVTPGIRTLMARRVPNYPFPERAVEAMQATYAYTTALSRPSEDPPRLETDTDAIRGVIESARSAGRLNLGEQEAREVVSACGLRVPESRLATNLEEAVDEAEALGYPLVMKVSSPDILHKSDMGGVKVGLADAADVLHAYRGIRDNVKRRMPRADVHGVLVQQMITGGKEVILGMNRDPQFGPLIMFGLGGIYVEVLKDVSFRLAPLTQTDADQMIREIKSFALLRGVRGEPPADLAAIADALLRLSQLAVDFPEIVEMDINPLIAFPKGKGAVALDARLTLSDK